MLCLAAFFLKSESFTGSFSKHFFLEHCIPTVLYKNNMPGINRHSDCMHACMEPLENGNWLDYILCAWRCQLNPQIHSLCTRRDRIKSCPIILTYSTNRNDVCFRFREGFVHVFCWCPCKLCKRTRTRLRFRRTLFPTGANAMSEKYTDRNGSLMHTMTEYVDTDASGANRRHPNSRLSSRKTEDYVWYCKDPRKIH